MNNKLHLQMWSAFRYIFCDAVNYSLKQQIYSPSEKISLIHLVKFSSLDSTAIIIVMACLSHLHFFTLFLKHFYLTHYVWLEFCNWLFIHFPSLVSHFQWQELFYIFWCISNKSVSHSSFFILLWIIFCGLAFFAVCCQV